MTDPEVVAVPDRPGRRHRRQPAGRRRPVTRSRRRPPGSGRGGRRTAVSTEMSCPGATFTLTIDAPASIAATARSTTRLDLGAHIRQHRRGRDGGAHQSVGLAGEMVREPSPSARSRASSAASASAAEAAGRSGPPASASRFGVRRDREPIEEPSRERRPRLVGGLDDVAPTAEGRTLAPTVSAVRRPPSHEDRLPHVLGSVRRTVRPSHRDRHPDHADRCRAVGVVELVHPFDARQVRHQRR